MIQPDFARYLAERFGTPIYAYDLDQIDQRAVEIRALLPSGSALFYSLKANPLPGLGAALREQGCRAEVSSPGELRAALLAGFAAADMLYTGPGKSPHELEQALAAGVHTFSAESWRDLYRLEQAARPAGARPAVLLRLNPAKAQSAQLSMSGVASQFGFEVQALLERAPELTALASGLAISGLHVYYGTQLDGAAAILSATRSVVQVAEELTERLDLAAQVLDLGGGFPWPYALAGTGPDLTPLQTGLDQLARQRRHTAQAHLWFESGRYLVASSGTLLTRVLDVKPTRANKHYLVLDTGIHHLGGMSGLGRILRPAVTFLPLAEPGPDRPSHPLLADVVGPLCTPLDCLARNLTLPPLQPGDLLAVPNVGAYGLTASLLHFLSRPAPVEVITRGTRVISAVRLQSGYEPL